MKIPHLSQSTARVGGRGGQQNGEDRVIWRGGVGHMARCRSGTEVCPSEVKTGACSEQQPLCVCVCVHRDHGSSACCSVHAPSAPENLNPTGYMRPAQAVEGAPVLCAASTKQEPFSALDNRRKTSLAPGPSGRRLARLHAYYHVSVTLRLNGFPPSFRKLAHGEGRTEWVFCYFFKICFTDVKRRKYSLLLQRANAV